MTLLHPLRRIALVLAVLVLATGCDGFDSGMPPNAPGDSEATVSFETESISITEESSPVEIGVTISNPPDDSVSVEVLYADGASSTDPSDFNLSEDAAVGGSGYAAGTVVFPDTATDGHTRTLELDIQDEEEDEPQENGIFVLQNVQGNASIGEANQVTVAIGAIEIFFEDFSDEELAPMMAYSVASNENWGVSSAGGADNVPYAVCNGFGANEPSNDWLITPALNFNDFEGETLTFLNAKGFNDSGRRGLQVKVSTNYDGSGNPEDFDWIDVSDQVTFSEGDFEFVGSGEVDLSGSEFQSDEVYVAFQYQSTSPDNAASWEVDNIRIVGR